MESTLPLEHARADSGVRTARLSDGVTAYDVHGVRGAWVVLVHGLATPMYAWKPLAVALEEAGFQVLRYDHFGRGLSDRPNVRYDLRLYVRQLRELMQAVGIDTAHLVGWSLGGVISTQLALEGPGSVGRLVLLSPALFMKRPGVLSLLSILPGALATRIVASKAGEAIEKLPAQHLAHPERAPGYLEPMREQLRHAGTRESFASTTLHFPWQAGPQLRAVGLNPRPVLVVWGDADPITPYANARRVLSLLPRAELKTIAGARHAPHVDQSGPVNAAIASFLTRA